MKKWKKLGIILLLVVVIIASVAYGVSKKNKAKEPASNVTTTKKKKSQNKENEISGKIVVWVNSAELANSKFDEYKKGFEENYPGTEIEYKIVTNYEIAGYQYLQQNTAGDVVMIPKKMTADEVKETFEPFGAVADLTESYKEKYLYCQTYEDVVYGLPECVMPQGIAYNKRVLEYAGVTSLPNNPEDFIKMLEQLRDYDSEIIPMYLDVDSLENWQMHAWGSVTGDPDYHYNGMVNETAPFAKNRSNYIVYQLLKSIVEEDLIQQTSMDMKAARAKLNLGEVGCMMVGFEELKALQEAGSNPDDIRYMPFPYNIGGKQYATTTYGYCYGVPVSSENKATAQAFVEYMLKKSGYATSCGAFSIPKKAALPTVLSAFSGVSFIVDNPPLPENEGKYDAICEKSGILLEDEKTKWQVIYMALQDVDETSTEESEDEKIVLEAPYEEEALVEQTEDGEEILDFESLMRFWNQKWRQSK